MTFHCNLVLAAVSMEVQQQIQALLQTPDPAEARRYHQKVGLNLLPSIHCSWIKLNACPHLQITKAYTGDAVEVCASAEPKGRGVFARKASASHLVSVHVERWQPCCNLVPQGMSAIAIVLQAFEAGLTLWREPPLVAGQDTENRGLCWVCSHCFKFLGSIEMQIAWRLVCQQAGGEPVWTVPALDLPTSLCPLQKASCCVRRLRPRLCAPDLQAWWLSHLECWRVCGTISPACPSQKASRCLSL